MRVRLLVAACAAVFLAQPAAAQPVEYVRICSAYGAGFAYIPGTDICANADTGETRRATVNGTEFGETELAQSAHDAEDMARDANEGVAVSLAIPTAIVDNGKSFGIAAKVGAFNGEAAIGVGGAFRVGEDFTVNGAVGVGLSRGTVGGSAGVNYSW